MMLLAVFAVVLFGSCMQRVSGMGLGLIGGPVLMLLMGPVEGILVINVLACINAALTTISVRHDVDWKVFAQIGAVMVLGSIPAGLLGARTDTAPLLVIVGGALLVALGVVTFGKRFVPQMQGTGPAVSAGILGGFTNTLAGIAGPVITVYAQAARWPQQMYTATLQPIFMVGGFISVTAKLLVGAGGFDGVSGWLWPVGLLAMLLGISTGTALARRVPRGAAHKFSLFIASVGAASAVIRGLTSL
ncbi:sulfite exporter TauE/SafE family protein [Corynebacterium sp. LK2590]|uniref:TSUP family transporter n=1 Tax=unclassified Corynebacterium TaxID=2624378 RepID=UPI0034CEBC69